MRSSKLGYCGVAGGAAAHQRAVHLEQSLQRELVCGSGAAACVAQTPSPASRAVQPGPFPSSASAQGRAIDSGRGCPLPAGRAGGVKRLTASSPTSHPPHPSSRRSRSSGGLIGGKAARRRRQPGRSEWSRRGRGSRVARGRNFRRLLSLDLTLPYLTLPYLRRVPTLAQSRVTHVSCSV